MEFEAAGNVRTGHDLGSARPSSPFAGILDRDFLAGLAKWAQEDSREGRSRLIHDLFRPRCEDLREAMTGAVVPRFQEERPYLDEVRYADGSARKGKPSTDSQVRIYRGRWKKDVGFYLMPEPTGFQVTFGCWMASRTSGVKDRFGRWARDESGDIRAAVLAAEERLREFGMSVMLLVQSRTDHYNPLMRRRPSSEEEWGIWAQNEGKAAQISARLAFPFNRDFIVEQVRKSEMSDRWDAAARMLGGLAEQQLFDLRDTSSLENALDAVIDKEQTRVVEMVLDGRLADAAWAAVCELMPIWERFQVWDLPRPRAVPSHVGWEVPVDDLADVIATTVGELTASRQVPSVVVTSKEKRTIAFREGTAAPRVVVRRAKDDGSVEFAFHLGKLSTKAGERAPSPWRTTVGRELRGRSGGELIGLAGAVGTAVRFDCGDSKCRRAGGCDVSTHDALVGHWLASVKDPSIRWSIPSAAGQASPFDAALELVAGLLSLSAHDPPALVVPSVEGLKWDAFVSYRGETESFSQKLATDLRNVGVSTWQMGDHQRPGSVVRENSLRGLRSSRVVVVVLSDGYWSSTHCVEELATALADARPVIPLVADTIDDDADGAVASARAALDELEDQPKVEAERVADWIRSALDPESEILYGRFGAKDLLGGKEALGALAAAIRKPSVRG